MLIRFRADSAVRHSSSSTALRFNEKAFVPYFLNELHSRDLIFSIQQFRSLINKAMFSDSATFSPRKTKHQYYIWSLQVKSLRFESYCDTKHWSTHHHQCKPEHFSSATTTFRFIMNVFMQRFLNKQKRSRFPCG